MTQAASKLKFAIPDRESIQPGLQIVTLAANCYNAFAAASTGLEGSELNLKLAGA
jgi:hypothetical protein